MKKHEIHLTYNLLGLDELSAPDRELVLAARRATEGSYAPYSNFRVGAALRLEDGSIVTGANQENAAYPCGICAERTALHYAQAQHPQLKITALAIAACNGDTVTTKPTTPCGLCRQALLEVERRQQSPITIMMSSATEVVVAESAETLLPLSFEF